jgi:multiple sugar transport system permease protein
MVEGRTAARLASRLARALAVLIAFLFLLPVAWIAALSLRAPRDVLAQRLLAPPTLDNYRVILIEDEAFLRGLGNSAIVALGATALALAAGVPAAYALARLPFRGRRRFWEFVLSTRMAPPAAMVIPFYVLYFRAGLLDTRLGLILLHGALDTSLVIWMLRGFFEDVPVELEEAARIDGCTRLGAFFRVTLPLAAPGLGATTIFALVASWNEFLFATMLTGGDSRTAPVAIAQFITFRAVVWGKLAAASVLTALPIVAVVLLVQRQLVRGLTSGAIKG